MSSYLLWYDDRPHTPPETKLRAAAEAFCARFQVVPRVAVVNPTQQPGGDVGGMRVVSRPWLLKNNFWIGMEEPQG